MNYLMIEKKMYGLVGKPYNDLHKLFSVFFFSKFNKNVKYITDALIDIESKIEESKFNTIFVLN